MLAAIITGTGMYSLPGVEFREEVVSTPYGPALVYRGALPDFELIFLARHGLSHDTPPHRINYRANIKALQMLGVRRVLAANTVGSINRAMPPLSLVVLSDFLDFTSDREKTFFDGGESGVRHIDVSTPYCPILRARLLELAPQFGLSLHPEGVYVCTNGPRLESPAEIRMFARLGADVVGMTGIPEATLAMEAGLCYASVAFSINWAAGLESKIEFHSHSAEFQKVRTGLASLFIETLRTTRDP